jgi:predicted AAA+ superfamily ATPase
MNIKDKIKLFSDMQKQDVPAYKRFAFEKVKNALKNDSFPIITGLRRTGKTTILKQLLIENKKSLYLNFRMSELLGLNHSEMTSLFIELYDEGYTTLLLDEVQEYQD